MVIFNFHALVSGATLLLAACGQAQVQEAWQRTYSNGDWSAANDIAFTATGDIYTCGSVTNTPGERDIAVAKYSTLGTAIWTAHYAGTAQLNDEAVTMAVGPDGSIVVAGYTDAGSLTKHDIVIVKFSPLGTLVWSTVYGGSENDEPERIIVDAQGNAFVGATTSSAQGTDLLVLKLSSSGVVLWNTTYTGAGVNEDFLTDMHVFSDGSVACAGVRKNGADSDALLLKYDNSGSLLWNGDLASQATVTAYANDLELTPDGGYIVVGTTRQGSPDFFSSVQVSKINSSGGFVWQRVLDGAAGKDDYGHFSRVAPDGTIFVFGSTSPTSGNLDHWIHKLDSTGATLASATWDGGTNRDDNMTDASLDSFGSMYVTGKSRRATSGWDLTTLKFGTNLQVLWEKRYSSPVIRADDSPSGLVLGSHGEVYVGGCGSSASSKWEFVTLRYNQVFPLVCTVDLGDYEGDSLGVSVELTVRDATSNAVLSTSTGALDASSQCSFDVATTGPIRASLKASHWLRSSTNLVTGFGPLAASFALTNGDGDGDNEVGIGDYALLSAAYGSSPGDGNWNESADLNGDLAVDIADYAILSSNYGLSGDE